MKKKTMALFMSMFIILLLTGCNEADRVSTNLSTQADNFNVLRQVTVINCIANDVVFQMTGKMSIKADTTDNQLELIVENENGTYSKHIIGLSDNVTYVDLCQYFGQKKLKDYATFFSSSSSFC